MQWSYEVDTNEVVPQYAMLDPPFRINRFALRKQMDGAVRDSQSLPLLPAFAITLKFSVVIR